MTLSKQPTQADVPVEAIDGANSAELPGDDRVVSESPLAILLERPTARDIDPGRVRDSFRLSKVWVLGFPVQSGTESDILHFTIDDDEGQEQVMLPAFTSKDHLRHAILRNQDWGSMSVLEVDGGELMTNIQKDITLVMDPWTPLEFQLRPDHR